MVGFHGYQMRSERTICRFWRIVQFAYVFMMDPRKSTFSVSVLKTRNRKLGSIIEFVYREATNGMPLPLDLVKKELQVA